MDRKSLSLQTVVETIVHEIQRLLVVHPIIALATKSAAFSDKQSTTESIRLVKYLRYLVDCLYSLHSPSLLFVDLIFSFSLLPENGPMIGCWIQEVVKTYHIATSCHQCGRYDLSNIPDYTL